MTKEILTRLDLIAAKLGQTAAALWPHAVRHTAIQNLAKIAIWMAFAILSAGLLFGGLVSGSKRKYEEGPWVMFVIPGAVLALFLFMSAVSGGADTIAGALEPVGHTVKAILKGR